MSLCHQDLNSSKDVVRKCLENLDTNLGVLLIEALVVVIMTVGQWYSLRKIEFSIFTSIFALSWSFSSMMLYMSYSATSALSSGSCEWQVRSSLLDLNHQSSGGRRCREDATWRSPSHSSLVARESKYSQNVPGSVYPDRDHQKFVLFVPELWITWHRIRVDVNLKLRGKGATKCSRQGQDFSKSGLHSSF